MGKKNCGLRQKKREGFKTQQKKQRKKRERGIDRQREQLPSPYTGNKYRTEELVLIHFHTEIGIYESFMMSDRQMTDQTVRSALQTLILQMRRGSLAPLETREDDAHDTYTDIGDDRDMIIWNVRRKWRHLFQTQPDPGRDKLIGVLRTILGSIDVWGSIDPNSRGYLHYIEDFLNNAGVHVEAYSSEEEMLRAIP